MHWLNYERVMTLLGCPENHHLLQHALLKVDFGLRCPISWVFVNMYVLLHPEAAK